MCAFGQDTLTPRHWCREKSTGEWDVAVVSSDVSRFCLYGSDGTVHVYGVDLVRIIIQSAFVGDTQPPPLRLNGVGAINYSSWLHLVFLQGKVNTTRYIAQVVNPVLLPFLRQEDDMLFHQDNARPHTAAAT